jgi:chemosensory pili system protein ChpB (putative protein-glutamate methylesterase)
MKTTAAPRVGVIADDMLSLHHVQALVGAAGYQVPLALTVDKVCEERIGSRPIDVWVVELQSTDAGDAAVDLIYSLADVPVLMGDGVPSVADPQEHERWKRRLREKLREVAVISEGAEVVAEDNPFLMRAHEAAQSQQTASHVWVLAASMGGPDAVKEFLDNLSPDLPVAFVYAQHINDDFEDLLAKVLGRDNSFRLSVCQHNHVLKHGQVSIVPTDRAVHFLPLGKVCILDAGWEPPFAPNLDQVIRSVAAQYKSNAGVIVFTGMSDDGAEGAISMRESGGEVWAQDPATCVCSSMPDAALATGTVSLTGSPRALAQALMQRFAREYVVGAS